MTVKLFHTPMACSLACCIAAKEGEVPLDICRVDLGTKDLIDAPGSLFDVNPLGQVSVLQFDDGTTLTETSVCINWIQAQSKNTSFRIDPESPKYFPMLRWLAFCATELHKQIFRVVFYPEATEEVKQRIRDLAPNRFDVLDKHLESQRFLLGDDFSAADAYISWALALSDRAKIDPTGYPNLERYRKDVLSRPSVANCITADQS